MRLSTDWYLLFCLFFGIARCSVSIAGLPCRSSCGSHSDTTVFTKAQPVNVNESRFLDQNARSNCYIGTSTSLNPVRAHPPSLSAPGNPRLPTRDLALTDFIGGWSLIWNDWDAFPPSPNTTSAFINFYTQICAIAVNETAVQASQYISLTFGALKITFTSLQQAIPGGFVEAFAQKMRSLARAGVSGLFTVVVYFMKIQIVWMLIIVALGNADNMGARARLHVIT